MAGEITSLLQLVKRGDRKAQEELYQLVYRELHSIASRRFRSERKGHTLQPTALVHEAYLRLLQQQNTDWKDRAHFFAVAAQIMRHILIDYARRQAAGKRGSAKAVVDFGDVMIVSNIDLDRLIAVDRALQELSELDERQAQIVEMRFFGGLTEEEVGEVLGLSARTIKREWTVAKAWLHAELGQ
jgi:RNA polymerase sigma factor (TIGR02999 family)